jgi:hypothetical protein
VKRQDIEQSAKLLIDCLVLAGEVGRGRVPTSSGCRAKRPPGGS